jgi:hypothetical protein
MGKLKEFFIPCEENNFRPQILEGKFLFYLLIVTAILKFSLLPLYLYLPKTSLFAEITKSALIELTNKTRQNNGLLPLKENPILSEAAKLKAQDMLSKNYFGHKTPEGFWTWHFIDELGYQYQVAGENLAIGFLDSEEVHKAWLNSPSHRANILNPSFREIGISVLKGNFQGNEVYLVVQLFASPKIVQAKESEIKKIATPEPKTQISKTEIITPEIAKIETSPIITPAIQLKEVSGAKTKSLPFLKNLILNYSDFVQKLTFVVLIFIILLLVLTVFIRIDIQYPDLILKTFVFILLLGLFFLIDKNIILYFVPHNVLIY